jgi:four helix bundle protein
MTSKFQAYEVALEMVLVLRPSVEALARRDKDLANQVRRAGSSVVLNLAEGARRWGKDRIHFYRISAGSAAEAPRPQAERAGARWCAACDTWR